MVNSKVFIYEGINGRKLLINAYENINSDIVLKIYIDWYNTSFAVEYGYPLINESDFEYVGKYTLFDFYNESKEIIKNAKS